MSQHDYNIADADGATVRADINDVLAAIVSNNAGTSAPATTFAHMTWYDTTNAVVKRRNAANGAWLIERTLDETFVLSRSSDTILDLSDRGKTIRATGNYTQTFSAVASLTDGWCIGFRVESGVTLTLDPNSSETIDGGSTLAIVGPASGYVVCNGSALYTVGYGVGASAASQSDVNAMTDTTKFLTPNHNKIVMGTEQATTSGTSIDFTSIPAGVRRITIQFIGVSTNGTSKVIVQIGDSGGVENSGYAGAASIVDSSPTNFSAGFILDQGTNASAVRHGKLVLDLEDSSDNTWTAAGGIGRSDSAVLASSIGSKALSAVLDRVRITTEGGTDTFDLGAINLTWER